MIAARVPSHDRRDRNMQRLPKPVAACALGLMLGFPLSHPLATPAAAQQNDVRPETFYGLAQETLPAVVSILAIRNADDGAGPGGPPGAHHLPPGREEFFERQSGRPSVRGREVQA